MFLYTFIHYLLVFHHHKLSYYSFLYYLACGSEKVVLHCSCSIYFIYSDGNLVFNQSNPLPPSFNNVAFASFTKISEKVLNKSNAFFST